MRIKNVIVIITQKYHCICSSVHLQCSPYTFSFSINHPPVNSMQNGLLVKFLNDFHGVIDTFSLSRPMTIKEWQVSVNWDDKEGKNEVYEARIVYVDHGAKSVRLSMRPHVLELRGAAGLPVLGTILEGLTIKGVAKKQGIIWSSILLD